MALQPGDTLLNGQYRILRQVGRGGFGFVYLAQDALLGEQVAIKELIPALVGDESTLKRFLAEARATMRLRHERIVGTHNVFSEGGNYYIVMEYLPGGSLEERLRERGSVPVDEAVRVAADVCKGLAHAHKEGIVHCDLKPGNILFDVAGQAKIADFGIAHVSGEMLTRSWHTPAGFVAGTLPYMSPEQTDGVRDDPRLDLYALGAVLYRMLTGRTYLEFDTQETPRAQVRNVTRICDETPLPPSHHNRQVPAWLDGVVLNALAKQPQARYADASQMRAALLEQERLQATSATPAATPMPARRQPTPAQAVVSHSTPAPAPRLSWPSRFWLAIGAVVVLIALCAVLLFDLAAQTLQEREPGAPARNTTSVPVPTSQPPGTPAASSAGETTMPAKDDMVMVYVPAGEFLMGSSDDDIDSLLAGCRSCKREWYTHEQPQHTVYLDAFWIDRTEVTNAQYSRCVQAGACTVSRCADDSDYNGAQQPVVCVDWGDAQNYCQWAGARLPTESEWEKAARGTDGRKYPWGDQAIDCSWVNYGNCVGTASQVGSYPGGASPYGALDMVGNVWEWVNDSYDDEYYGRSPARNPQGPDSGSMRVLRGGSWGAGYVQLVRTASRYRDVPSNVVDYRGFRCARSDSEP